jgi:hypothetical protein
VLPALLILAVLFGLLFIGRVGAARRAEVIRRWPAALFALAAILALWRGALWPALAFASLAALTWIVWPSLVARRRATAAQPREGAADVEARAILGVGPTATDSEIRSAYRAKMTRAHPDRGGSNAEAARLTAARDRLLRSKR